MTSRQNRDVKTEYQNIVRMEYQMNSGYFYAMLSRMKYINRWGLMRNTKNENLSEHSLETAFIAHALGIINNEVFHGSVNAEHLAVLDISLPGSLESRYNNCAWITLAE